MPSLAKKAQGKVLRNGRTICRRAEWCDDQFNDFALVLARHLEAVGFCIRVHELGEDGTCEEGGHTL